MKNGISLAQIWKQTKRLSKAWFFQNCYCILKYGKGRKNLRRKEVTFSTVFLFFGSVLLISMYHVYPRFLKAASVFWLACLCHFIVYVSFSSFFIFVCIFYVWCLWHFVSERILPNLTKHKKKILLQTDD